MSAVHPPYHLRTNKAVDRLLFLDQISKALSPTSINGTYHSLGGPFMEDLRLIHRRFPRMKLMCIEADLQTHKRQKAHRFTRHLATCHRTLADFLNHDYNPDTGDIFWLDFTDFDSSRLTDFQELLRKILPGSIIRITVRSEMPINDRLLSGYLETERIKELKTESYKKLKVDLDRLVPPEWVGKNPTSPVEHTIFVQQIIRQAASEVLDKAGVSEFLHLGSAYYDDGTRMLSTTGLICNRQDIKREIARLKAAGLATDAEWKKQPAHINLPHLSVQERISLDERLPIGPKASAKSLQRRLGYWVGSSDKNSQEALRQYANYYQEYPSFLRFAY